MGRIEVALILGLSGFLLGLCLLVAGCSGGGSSPPPNPWQPPIGSSWTQFFGSGVNIDSTGSFDIPASPGSVHYVARPATATLGQTVTLKFQITGSGTWGISDTTDSLPPTIHLFLWERGDDGSGQGAYEFYRLWAGKTDIANPGVYQISVKLDPTLWLGVFAHNPTAAQFQQLLGNLYGVGFTFGGASFDGHGIYSATGLFHFTLISYTIQ